MSDWHGKRPTPAVRTRREEDGEAPLPLHAVWEVTMRCDQACAHCGSRAARARPRELTTSEALAVVAQLAHLGCREVALIGGEAYLRDDIHVLVQEIAARGMRPIMQTGGRTLTRARARALRAAGLEGIGVSVDGPEAIHDQLRDNAGSHRAALEALALARDEGFCVTANTQINKLNVDHIEATFEQLRQFSIRSWQVQLTVPMGRAADRPEWIVDPWQVVAIIDRLAALQLRVAAPGGIDIVCGNNLGYYGPHEVVMRSRPGGPAMHWGGCGAGINLIGIESDGTIKGCPSLPTEPYRAGNILELTIEDIWLRSEEMSFARDRDGSELWGHCRDCYYASECQGGCSWMAHAALGRRGNNPFCYHRVNELRQRGLRERLVLTGAAPQEPYDTARFALIEEPWDAELPADQAKPARRSLPVL